MTTRTPKDTTERVKRPKTSGKQPKTDAFCLALKSQTGILPEREFLFHPTRKWRFDYAIPELKIAVEKEGGVWTGGRHTTPQGFLGDIEKYNQAALLGWRLFRFASHDLFTKATFDLLRQATNPVKVFTNE